MNWWMIVLLSLAIAVLTYIILREPSEDASSRFLDALSRLSVSYVTGVIIYLLAVALPRRQNQRNIGESIGPRTRKIINHADETLGWLNRHSSESAFDRRLVTREDVKRLCKVVNPWSETVVRLVTDLSRQATVVEMLGHLKIQSELEIQRILVFSIYLDTSFIRLLNQLLDSSYFVFCNAYFIGEGLRMFRPATHNLKDVDVQLFDYFQIINKLEEYADTHLK
ncbi:MAG: hypothetical protein HY914_11195 [Desulfomonile tiedjei]|nr:hypothetical protein [Desulfomonile tiedjei]